MEHFVSRYLGDLSGKNITVVDVGSQDVNGSYKALFGNPNWKYIGLDIVPGKNVDIVTADIYDWKELGGDSADVVISGQAMEHIECFWLVFKEMFRIMKPGGWCCIIVPSSGPEHKFPIDCWRFFPDGLKALSKYCGLEIVELFICDQDIVNGEPNQWKDSVLIAKKPKKE